MNLSRPNVEEPVDPNSSNPITKVEQTGGNSKLTECISPQMPRTGNQSMNTTPIGYHKRRAAAKLTQPSNDFTSQPTPLRSVDKTAEYHSQDRSAEV